MSVVSESENKPEPVVGRNSGNKQTLNPFVCRVCERDELMQEAYKLQQEVEFLTGVLDDTVKLYRGEYRGYADLGDVLQPYLNHKKPPEHEPEHEIKPWSRWSHKDGVEYILCFINQNYQLIRVDGKGQWSIYLGKTPLESFAGDFDQFTQMEGES